MAATIYDHINRNKKTTAVIVAFFPLLLCILMYATIWLFVIFTHGPQDPTPPSVIVNSLALNTFPLIIIAAFVWILISYLFGDKMMMAAAEAYEIKKEDNPLIYNLVENIAITSGMPLPKIYIIPDRGANAFATGRSPETASIALTKGLIDRLEKREIEAVIAHEMGHIANRDVRLMMIVIIGIGAITLLGEILLRAGARSRKNGGVIAILGLVLLVYGLVLAPLIMYALSRNREYQADASAALMTRDPEALASALIKISGDSQVAALNSMGLMSAACIADASGKVGLNGVMTSLFSTHPPIEKRVEALRAMGGR